MRAAVCRGWQQTAALVRRAIILDGVNDIMAGASFSTLKTYYDDLIRREHAKGLLIWHNYSPVRRIQQLHW